MFSCRQESTEKQNHNLIVLTETTFQAHQKYGIFCQKGNGKNILPYRIFTTKHCSLLCTLRKHKNTLKSIWRNCFFRDNAQMSYSLQIFSNFYLYCSCSASHHTTDLFFCLDMFRYCTPLSCDYLFSQDAQHFTFSFYYLLQ